MCSLSVDCAIYAACVCVVLAIAGLLVWVVGCLLYTILLVLLVWCLFVS